MKKALLLLSLLVMQSTYPCEDQQQNKNWLFDTVSYFLAGATSGSPSDIAKNLVKEIYPLPRPTTTIQVQTNNHLSPQERLFIENRMSFAQETLKEEFGIEKPLRLGFCCSGGGNRAMIGTLGLLTGAAKTKVLDTSLYISGVSGSTWLISQFLYLAATRYKDQRFEIVLQDIKESYAKRLDDYSMLSFNGIYLPPLLSFESTDDVAIEIAKRFTCSQTPTLVNLFGSLVGDYALDLMGNDRLSEKWSNIYFETQKGYIPLPLCSAVFENDPDNSDLQYEWFEMSPLQVGSSSLGYIPVQFLGSKFQNGILDTDNICYEYPLSFYLGVYGSAFAVTIQEIGTIQKSIQRNMTLFKDIYKEAHDFPELYKKRKFLLENSFVRGIIDDIIYDLITCRNPLTHASFPNYSENLTTSSLKDYKEVDLIDGAIDFDLPIPALVDRPERNLDIIILYGSHPGDISYLRDIASYCKRKNTPFPSLSGLTNELLQSQDMTVLNDPRSQGYDASMTTYLYFPTNNININTFPYVTFNFKYPEEDMRYLSEKTERSFVSQVDQIKEIMQLVAQKRH